MFNKTRRKIVITVVFSLLILMAVTLATIFISNRVAHRRDNEEMLKMYAERYSPDELPGEPGERPGGKPDGEPGIADGKQGPRDGEPGKNEPRFELSTFYAVAYSDNGDVIAVNNGNQALQSDESLLETADRIIKSGKTSGRTGNMTYLVEKRDGYTLVALIDGTINEKDQSRLFYQMLIIGASSMLVLFVLSIFLARRIVRPLEENDRRQKRFVSDAGHELKTPIAVISANSELLKRQLGENEWLDNIDYENGRMSDLVKQLLDLSKAEKGDLPKEPLDFSKLVSGEALPFESLAFEKGIRINSDIEPGVTVKGDKNRLRQLVSILLDNAISHGTGDTVNLSLHKDRHFAALSVSNEAKEISEEQLSRLFDRFYKTDEVRGDTGSHYGLGLSIAKAAAEAHGGRITAAYKDGKAVFTVLVPV